MQGRSLIKSVASVMVLTTLLATSLLIGGCGSNSEIFAVINGKKIGLPVDGVDAIAGGLGSQIVSDNSGVNFTGTSLSILIRYINGNIVDLIQFDIQNLTAVPLGQQVFVDQANVIASATVNGVAAFVAPGSGNLILHEAGLADGQSVRGEFQLNTATAYLFGDFSTEVRLGF